MKLIKRSLTLLLGVVLLISTVAPALALVDITAPVPKSITFSESSGSVDDTIEVVMECDEDGSGVSYAQMYLKGSEYGKEIYCYLSSSYYDEELYRNVQYSDGKLHGTLELNEYLPTDTYLYNYCHVWDKADNEGYYYWYDLTQPNVTEASFSLTSSALVDETAPVPKELCIDKDTANVGESIEFTLDCIETGSGVKTAYIWYKGITYGKTELISLRSTYWDGKKQIPYSDGKIHGTFLVDEDTAEDEYWLYRIEIYDNADNQNLLYAFEDERLPLEVKQIKFSTVNASTTDFTAPVPTALSVDKSVAYDIGDTIDMAMSFTGDYSGFISSEVILMGETYGKQLSLYLGNTYWDVDTQTEKQYADGKMHGEITIDENCPTDTYRVYCCQTFASGYNNVHYYYDNEMPYDIRNFSLSIVNPEDVDIKPHEEEGSSGIVDRVAPVIKSVTLEETSANVGDTIHVTVDAPDDISGTDYAYLRFFNSVGDSIGIDAMSKRWDPETEEYSPYPDGLQHGARIIDKSLPTGDYYLKVVSVNDTANNYRVYSASKIYSNGEFLPQSLRDLMIHVENNTVIEDTTPPIPNSVILSSVKATEDSPIEIIASATDASGVGGMTLEFVNEVGYTYYCGLDTDYWDENSEEYIPYTDGYLHGKIHFSKNVPSGTFNLVSIDVRDTEGNRANYVANMFYGTYGKSIIFPAALKGISFEFTNEHYVARDSTAPTIQKIELSSNSIKAPGYVDVTVTAEDDTGATFAYLTFRKNLTQSVYASCQSYYWDEDTQTEIQYADGKLHGSIYVSQYADTGDYSIYSVNMGDNEGNFLRYGKNRLIGDALIPKDLRNITLTVTNPDDWADVSTSTANVDFIDKISDSEDDAVIIADFSNNTTLSENVFESIKGTNKQLNLISEGVTWTFNGSDIAKVPKDIDLSVNNSNLSALPEEEYADVAEIVKDAPTVVLQFADNGVLPGKATVRIKADYTMREYLGTEGLYIYYFNKTTGNLEPIASNITLTADYYLEFDITHCSDYIVTKGDVLPHHQHNGSHSYASGHTFITDLPIGTINKVSVDGKVVDSKYYIISGGNVTLAEEFLTTLTNGQHTVVIENSTHMAKATFTTSNAGVTVKVTSAATADMGVALYGVLSVSSLLGMGWVSKKKR